MQSMSSMRNWPISSSWSAMRATKSWRRQAGTRIAVPDGQVLGPYRRSVGAPAEPVFVIVEARRATHRVAEAGEPQQLGIWAMWPNMSGR